MSEQLTLFDLPKSSKPVIRLKALKQPIWTENKAKLIERYLYYFVLITKHGAYIDGFAGPQKADKPEMWAAKLVLESEPRWLRHFFLCDKDPKQIEQLRSFVDSQPSVPNRTIQIYPENFNTAVDTILGSGRIGQKEATFCLLDQRTFECHWATLEKLAAYKTDGMKIELFYFLTAGWLDRAISAQRDKSVLEAWWGREDWDLLQNMKGRERAEVFCNRFMEELGYQLALAWEIRNKKEGGRVMYYMIHASDHPEAPNLMHRAYRNAVSKKEPPEQFLFEFEQWRSSSNQPLTSLVYSLTKS